MAIESFKAFERYVSLMILMVIPLEILISLTYLGFAFTYDITACSSIMRSLTIPLLSCLFVSCIILISTHSILPVFVTTLILTTLTINHLMESFVSNCYLMLVNAVISFVISLCIKIGAPYLLLSTRERKQLMIMLQE